MIAVDCYWQDWAIRLDLPDTTWLCKNDSEVEDCKQAMKKAEVQKVIVNTHPADSVGQAPQEWNNERRDID